MRLAHPLKPEHQGWSLRALRAVSVPSVQQTLQLRLGLGSHFIFVGRVVRPIRMAPGEPTTKSTQPTIKYVSRLSC